jgi:hypothetical protein
MYEDNRARDKINKTKHACHWTKLPPVIYLCTTVLRSVLIQVGKEKSVLSLILVYNI